jgi:hypothetical protein
VLVHDRHDGSCWLWDYHHGVRFLEADEPVATQKAAAEADEGGSNDLPDSSKL